MNKISNTLPIQSRHTIDFSGHYEFSELQIKSLVQISTLMSGIASWIAALNDLSDFWPGLCWKEKNCPAEQLLVT